MEANTLIQALNTSEQRWQELNLETLKTDLEDHSVLITQNQKDSVEARKMLAQLTKEFKKSDEKKKLESIKDLLKGYQLEIDNLTKRCKASENKVIYVFDKINELPDPATLFNKSYLVIQNLKGNDDNEQKLVKENNNLKQNVKELQDKLQLEENNKKQFDELLVDQVAKKEYELNLEIQSINKSFNVKEKQFMDKINSLEIEIQTLKQTQMLVENKMMQTSIEDKNNSENHIHQYQLLINELNDAKEHINLLMRENESLKNSNSNNVNHNSTTDSNQIEILNKTIEKQDVELEQFIKKLENVKKENNNDIQKFNNDIQQLKLQLQEQLEENNNLNKKLEKVKDYDTIKNELEVLKFVEFPEENGTEKEIKSPLSDTFENKELMAALIRKNKNLQNQNTLLTNQNKLFKKDLDDKQLVIMDNQKQLEDLKALVNKLEMDLNCFDDNKDNSPMSPTSPTTTTSNSVEHILPIISKQRDRFRFRNMELEEEIRNLKEQLEHLEFQKNTINNENLQLYEQIKFNKYYNNQQHQVINIEELDNKYNKIYEQDLDPITVFKKKEENRRYQTLNTTDRLALSLTKLFLMNYFSRIILLVYLFCLHGLIIILLYYSI